MRPSNPADALQVGITGSKSTTTVVGFAIDMNATSDLEFQSSTLPQSRKGLPGKILDAPVLGRRSARQSSIEWMRLTALITAKFSQT
jgi:hypothetical protein